MTDDDTRGADGLFRKGRSGNPKGRPRKDKTVSAAILKAMNETITATENGRRRRVRKVDAAAKQFANKGAAGDVRAGKIFLDMAARAEEQTASAPSTSIALTQSDTEILERFLDAYRCHLEESER
jgi:replication-associated recombination protein RarA